MNEPPFQLPNPTELAILLTLTEGERHGYAIMQEVASQSGGAAALGPATLYGAIKRMLAAGWIEEGATTPPAAGSRNRRNYRMTPAGRAAARAAARQLADTVALAAERGLLALKPLVKFA